MLTLEDISFVSRRTAILNRVGGEAPDRVLTCVVGPNGAGKTTLLRILSGELKATSGRFLIGDVDAARLSQREIARQVSIIPQDVQPPTHLTVSELVQLGRFRARGALWQRLSKLDRVAVDTSLASCQIYALSGRRVEELSGGEQRRAWLAFGLAQAKRFLLLDETLDGLDIFSKRSFFKLLREVASRGTGIVLTSHDLDLVSDYADKVIVLSSGKVVYEGPPTDDLEQRLLNAIECHLETDRAARLVQRSETHQRTVLRGGPWRRWDAGWH
jgi:ABC-type cobalamin/Fe3+-siderophores transport system ATPase subunit